MTIVVYEDVIVPNNVILAGVVGRQKRENVRTRNQGGYATVNAVRDVTLREYQLGIAPMKVDAWQAIEGLYEITDAGAFGMLLEDPKDSSVTTAQGALQGYMAGVESGILGFGNGTPNYGIRKIYTASGSSRKAARAVTRLKGTASLLRGGSPVTIGVSAGNAAISAGPSYVTFVADTTRSLTGMALGATTTVTLSTAIPGLIVGGKLWLQGMAGADAALLNNLSHTITNIASNVYTLSVNTAGKAITSGAAAAHKYPQPDEALTWSGSYYIPVQFRDDDLEWELVTGGARDARMVTGPSFYLDEVREA
jgi:hypothetical protein